MESNLSEFEEEPLLRPTLLNVLCILTFIGSSWAIITNIWAYNTAAKTAQMVSYLRSRNIPDSMSKKDSIIYKVGDKKRLMFGEKTMLSFTKLFTADAIRKNALGGMISAVLTLLGALLMWRLRRMGFYLYIVGVIIGAVIPFYLYGNNVIAVGISAFSGFFGFVFIALYALNFRALRK